MPTFAERVDALVRPMDPVRHSAEIARLRACRSLAELEAIAREGWLTAPVRGPRLKLVRHGSGTLLVVEYDDGWSKTISQG